MAANVIDVKNAKKFYRVGQSAIKALDGVDLIVEQGEFCCIVGRSGSGKSTLLNLMAGLEKPTAGEIIVSGKHVEQMSESELIMFRQKNVGFIFQSFNLLGHYTALENVALPLRFRGIPKSVCMKRAKKILSIVGLETHLYHKPAQMSGGQQQRVGVARALVADPPIIFADEPTGNLDSKTSEDIIGLMKNIASEQGKTFIMVTHDHELALLGDKIVHILDGQITRLDRPHTEGYVYEN